MAEVGREAFARRGEAFHRVKGTLSQGQPPGEVGVGGQGRGKPVPQPSDFVFGWEVQVVKPDACGGGGVRSWGVRQWTSSVFGTEKDNRLGAAVRHSER